MKISVVSELHNSVYNAIVYELKHRGLYGDGDVVLNIDPCVGVFTQGKKTLFWERDDFLNINSRHYDHLIDMVDIHYIVHPEYLQYRSNAKVLPFAFEDRYVDIKKIKKYEFGFGGSLIPIDIYVERIEYLNKINEVYFFRDRDYKQYLSKMAQCEYIIDGLPRNPNNNLSCLHPLFYEATVLSQHLSPPNDLLKNAPTKDEILKHHMYKNRVDTILNDL